MQVFNGGDLKNFVEARGGFLMESEARVIFGQIIKGVAAIRAQGIVHRNLTLENIMINFKNLEASVCIASNFDINKYITNFDMAENQS